MSTHRYVLGLLFALVIAPAWGATPPPACMVSTSSTSPYIGTSVTLVASCINSPTSYSWVNCASGTSVCSASSPVAGTVNYAVSATNGSGTGAQASVNVYWQATALPPSGPVPSCLVTSSSASPVAGTSITLTAACSGNPYVYAWSNCTSTTSTCVTSSANAGSVVYAVGATNGAGPGMPASMAVDWQAAPPPPPVPACTVSPSNAVPAVETTVLLTASCTNSPTSFAWTNCASTASTCSTSSASAGARTYAVTATNGVGTGATASTSVNWQAVVPNCTLAASPASPAVGAAVTLTANCTGTPTSYVWTNCTSSNASCSITRATAGTTPFFVTAQNSAGTASAYLSVTWLAAGAPLAVAAPSTCSITATATGTNTYTLAASAGGGGAVTSYSWTGGFAQGNSGATVSGTISASTAITVVMANSAGTCSATRTLTASTTPGQGVVTVVEYFHTVLNHYFITANAMEIADLDSGVHPGWARTGQSFKALDSALATPAGASPVCRFYGDPKAGLDSHFYSASPKECADVKAKFVVWIFEADNVFQIYLPDPATGFCASGTQPVYRTFNNRVDVNHRYTTNLAIQAYMVAIGGLAEGYGNPPVVMCAPL
ncbi:MAG: hypothetical protein ABI624_13435 [Casimicrobiaceae bacterium]